MAGPLKTLFQALQASSFMAGVTLGFGEEMIPDQGSPLPYICMVPRGGTVIEPGYAMDGSTSPGSNPPLPSHYIDGYTENLWQVSTQVQFYIWALSDLPAAQPID